MLVVKSVPVLPQIGTSPIQSIWSESIRINKNEKELIYTVNID